MTINLHADLLLSLFPLVLLIYLMVKKKSMPAHKALPLAAAVLYILKILYFHSAFTESTATVINGLLTALTPILVVWGAIFLFKAMEHSGAMAVIRTWLNGITANRTAQIMIVGWAFAFLIEGASGFGTPAAIAAPILVGLGVTPVSAVIVCLIFNTVPVTFGVVGVPTWFGLGELGLTNAQILQIGFESAIVNTIAAMVVPVVGLFFVVPRKEIKANLLYIYLSIFSCVIPYLIVARFNYEFPSVIGGFIGTIVSIWLAKKGIGLAGAKEEKFTVAVEPVSVKRLVKVSFALWATVLVLLITRIEEFGIKGLLNSAAHSIEVNLGMLGKLGISPTLVISLTNIFGTENTWVHKTLYVPSIVPFFVVGFASFFLLKTPKADMMAAWSEAVHRMRKPVIALLGTLVFAKLLMAGGKDSCTMIIGGALANAAGRYWYWFSPLLGAMGSFFAGSNTVSNLTFAPIQDSIAARLGLNRIAVLVMQSVGGAMGKMICIHDIVAACSVLGVTGLEGHIIKRTIIPMLIYAAIAAACVHLLLLF